MPKLIRCENCWKQIEQKGNRVLCIKCSNKRDKKMAENRRKLKRDWLYVEHP